MFRVVKENQAVSLVTAGMIAVGLVIGLGGAYAVSPDISKHEASKETPVLTSDSVAKSAISSETTEPVGVAKPGSEVKSVAEVPEGAKTAALSANASDKAQASVAKKAAKQVNKAAAKDLNSPLAVVQEYEKDIKSILQKYKDTSTEVARKDRAGKIRSRINRFFDFAELARLSLGERWGKLNKADRTRFQSTFVKLIERSYLDKSHRLVAEYDVEYDKQTVNGKRARVNSKIKKDDLDVYIGYEMHRPSKSWLIYNVIFDDLNMLNNYRSQFNRVISENSFAYLIERMEDRLKNPGAASAVTNTATP